MSGSPNPLPTLLASAVLILAGCTTIPRDEPAKHRYDPHIPLAQQFPAIKLQDGIDATEADILTTLYFSHYNGMSGSSLPVVPRGKDWLSRTIIGPMGAIGPPIRIDQITGIITWPDHPASPPPWSDLK